MTDVSILIRVTVLGALLTVPHLASAQGGAAASAEALFRDGAAALKRGELGVACDELARSNELDAAIGTLGLLALCHEQQGRIATAAAEYRTVASLARSANQPERVAIANARVEELSPRICQLQLSLPRVPPDQLSIEVGGQRLTASEASAPYPLDPGATLVRISADGFEPYSETINVGSDGSTIRFVVPELQARRPRSEAAPKRAFKRGAPPPMSTNNDLSTLTWVALGTGGAGIALGGFFGVQALSRNSESGPHCTGNDCDLTGWNLRKQALHNATASTVAFAIGTAALGASLLLYLKHDSERPTLSAQLKPLQTGGVVSLGSSF